MYGQEASIATVNPTIGGALQCVAGSVCAVLIANRRISHDVTDTGHSEALWIQPSRKSLLAEDSGRAKGEKVLNRDLFCSLFSPKALSGCGANRRTWGRSYAALCVQAACVSDRQAEQCQACGMQHPRGLVRHRFMLQAWCRIASASDLSAKRSLKRTEGIWPKRAGIRPKSNCGRN